MSRATQSAVSYLLALTIGVFGALVLAHWAACEQHEGFCSLEEPK